MPCSRTSHEIKLVVCIFFSSCIFKSMFFWVSGKCLGKSATVFLFDGRGPGSETGQRQKLQVGDDFGGDWTAFPGCPSGLDINTRPTDSGTLTDTTSINIRYLKCRFWVVRQNIGAEVKRHQNKPSWKQLHEAHEGMTPPGSRSS